MGRSLNSNPGLEGSTKILILIRLAEDLQCTSVQELAPLSKYLSPQKQVERWGWGGSYVNRNFILSSIFNCHISTQGDHTDDITPTWKKSEAYTTTVRCNMKPPDKTGSSL